MVTSYAKMRITVTGYAKSGRRPCKAVVVSAPAVVLNADNEIVGYTICNDMSSRSIEGQNPLYLPQAKVYLGGCALGPSVRPAWEVSDPYALIIELTITRGHAVVWTGSASTSALHRRIDELAGYLFREDEFPAGAILSTGTSLIPDLPFTLQAGDEIRIAIGGIGELVNPVVRGKRNLRHYSERLRASPVAPAYSSIREPMITVLSLGSWKYSAASAVSRAVAMNSRLRHAVIPGVLPLRISMVDRK